MVFAVLVKDDSPVLHAVLHDFIIYEYAAEYNKRFGQIFPIEKLKMNYKYSEILDMAVKCLELGKDIRSMRNLKMI